MFELRDFSAFKQHARDFLVQTKSFADKDNAELFAEEAAAMREVRGLVQTLISFMGSKLCRSLVVWAYGVLSGVMRTCLI